MTPEHLASLDPIFAECLRVGGPLVGAFTRIQAGLRWMGLSGR